MTAWNASGSAGSWYPHGISRRPKSTRCTGLASGWMNAAARGDAVVLPRRHAGLDLAPGAGDVALGLQRVERRVDVALRDLEGAVGAVTDRRDDFVAVP